MQITQITVNLSLPFESLIEMMRYQINHLYKKKVLGN